MQEGIGERHELVPARRPRSGEQVDEQGDDGQADADGVLRLGGGRALGGHAASLGEDLARPAGIEPAT